MFFSLSSTQRHQIDSLRQAHRLNPKSMHSLPSSRLKKMDFKPAYVAIIASCLISLVAASFGGSVPPAHMRTLPRELFGSVKQQDNSTGGGGIPIIIRNECAEIIHPGINTQHGTKPSTSGFELKPGESKNLTVSPDWQGRIWGRTNCTDLKSDAVSGSKRACGTGDCAGAMDCVVAGDPPVTLAEFTLNGHGGLSFYDISLVDGFNIGLAIIMLANSVPELHSVPASKTNPSCVAAVGDFNETFSPYKDEQIFLGSTKNDPLPFTTDVSRNKISRWCPWDLQVNPPQKPGNGVYAYPDDNIPRPDFQACYSACAKYHAPKDCCTGSYNNPKVCKGGLYSKNAKEVCPDAYTFAYDDEDSTFTTKTGAGFEVVFCSKGKSTTILKKSGGNALSMKKSMAKPVKANAETSVPPWFLLTGAALIVTACVFSSL